MIYVQLISAGILLISSLRVYQDPLSYSFIQSVNLIFHEAGHVLFFWAGHFWYVLGGTVGELAIPLLVTGYFLKQRAWFASFFGFWWLASTLFSVGRYAADARTQALPLITGDPSSHDWTYLLSELGLLRQDQLIGDSFIYLSYLALIAGLICLGIHTQNYLRKKSTTTT